MPNGEAIARRARRDARHADDVAAESDHRRRARSRAQEGAARISTTRSTIRSSLAVALSDAIAQGDWRLFFLAARSLAHRDGRRRQRVATQYLKSSNRDDRHVHARRRSPTARRCRRASTSPALVKDYKGDAAVAAGESFDPTPANLEARTQRFALPNGMKVALLPKKTRGETVQIAVAARTSAPPRRLRNSKSRRRPSPPSMLERGTAKHDRQEFADALDKLRAKLRYRRRRRHGRRQRDDRTRQRAGRAAARGRSVARAGFPAGGVRADETRAARRRSSRAAATRRRSHAAPSRAQAIRIRPTTSATRRRSTRRSIACRAPDLAAVKAFHAQFYGASHAELAIVGDFDAAAVKRPDHANCSATGRARHRTRASRSRFIRRRPRAQTFETPDKANAAMFGRLSLPLNDEAADFAALLVANRILGGDSDSRIFKRVRVKDGLSLFGRIGVPAGADRRATARSSSTRSSRRKTSRRCRPPPATNLRARAMADSPSRKSRRRRRRCSRSGASRVRRMTRWPAHSYRRRSSAARGRTPRRSMPRSKRRPSASVNAALRKYVDPAGIAYAYAGDFAKAK